MHTMAAVQYCPLMAIFHFSATSTEAIQVHRVGLAGMTIYGKRLAARSYKDAYLWLVHTDEGE